MKFAKLEASAPKMAWKGLELENYRTGEQNAMLERLVVWAFRGGMKHNSCYLTLFLLVSKLVA
jgi:hypothetical protein